jgi:hypothetical protein
VLKNDFASVLCSLLNGNFTTEKSAKIEVEDMYDLVLEAFSLDATNDDDNSTNTTTYEYEGDDNTTSRVVLLTDQLSKDIKDKPS